MIHKLFTSISVWSGTSQMCSLLPRLSPTVDQSSGCPAYPTMTNAWQKRFFSFFFFVTALAMKERCPLSLNTASMGIRKSNEWSDRQCCWPSKRTTLARIQHSTGVTLNPISHFNGAPTLLPIRKVLTEFESIDWIRGRGRNGVWMNYFQGFWPHFIYSLFILISIIVKLIFLAFQSPSHLNPSGNGRKYVLTFLPPLLLSNRQIQSCSSEELSTSSWEKATQVLRLHLPVHHYSAQFCFGGSTTDRCVVPTLETRLKSCPVKF